MVGGQFPLSTSIDDFFSRCGLTPQAQRESFIFIERSFPGRPLSPVSSQGYCSLTVVVGHDLIVQLRPEKYRLDGETSDAARLIYSEFAPVTRYVTTIPTGLLMYTMDMIRGVSLKEFRDTSKGLEPLSMEFQTTLVKDFAVFTSKGWHGALSYFTLGTVGQSIASRLMTLGMELPARFRPVAQRLAKELHNIMALPWVLTHGDILAGNAMIDPSSGHLFGLVDWAEAEMLPFGLGLYGLEEFLGEMTPNGFQYCPNENTLRGVFWEELTRKIPELGQPNILQTVKYAKDLGVILFHGIAFDNGAISRVVQEGKDLEEIKRLDAFLELDNP